VENVEHHNELAALAKELNIEEQTVFRRSISNDERLLLLQNTDLLLYTPQNEHFGIVPVEAMHLGCVVLACNSGGPLESIGQNAATSAGFLLEPKADVWAT
jgi:alpha-1,3/alpha-1,6-mannosyltransferase